MKQKEKVMDDYKNSHADRREEGAHTGADKDGWHHHSDDADAIHCFI